jgi:hypothetical protein
VVFWSKRDTNVRPLHHPSRLNALSQVDLTLDLLSLCLQGDGHATSEDYLDLSHLFITIKINHALILLGLLRHRCYWRWHLLPIRESLALFQIVSYGAVNLTPVFHVIRMLERHLLFLIRGMLTAVAMIFTISSVSCVDLPIFLLLRGPLAAGLQESSLGLGSLYALIYDHE